MHQRQRREKNDIFERMHILYCKIFVRGIQLNSVYIARSSLAPNIPSNLWSYGVMRT